MKTKLQKVISLYSYPNATHLTRDGVKDFKSHLMDILELAVVCYWNDLLTSNHEWVTLVHRIQQDPSNEEEVADVKKAMQDYKDYLHRKDVLFIVQTKEPLPTGYFDKCIDELLETDIFGQFINTFRNDYDEMEIEMIQNIMNDHFESAGGVRTDLDRAIKFINRVQHQDEFDMEGTLAYYKHTILEGESALLDYKPWTGIICAVAHDCSHFPDMTVNEAFNEAICAMERDALHIENDRPLTTIMYVEDEFEVVETEQEQENGTDHHA